MAVGAGGSPTAAAAAATEDETNRDRCNDPNRDSGRKAEIDDDEQVALGGSQGPVRDARKEEHRWGLACLAGTALRPTEP